MTSLRKRIKRLLWRLARWLHQDYCFKHDEWHVTHGFNDCNCCVSCRLEAIEAHKSNNLTKENDG